MKALIMLGLALVSEGATGGATQTGLAAQECRPLDTPKRTPSLNQILDSVALVADLTGAERKQAAEVRPLRRGEGHDPAAG